MAISKRIGLRYSSDVEELKIIAGFIGRNFGDITGKELTRAFDMVLAGKLGVDDNKIEHYQSFNCKYVGHILGKYRKVRNDAIKKFEASVKQHEEEKEIKRMNTEEFHQESYEGLISLLAEGKCPENWNWLSVWKHMNKNGMTPPIGELKEFADGQRNNLNNMINDAKTSGNQVQLGIYETIRNNELGFRKWWRARWVELWAKNQS